MKTPHILQIAEYETASAVPPAACHKVLWVVAQHFLRTIATLAFERFLLVSLAIPRASGHLPSSAPVAGYASLIERTGDCLISRFPIRLSVSLGSTSLSSGYLSFRRDRGAFRQSAWRYLTPAGSARFRRQPFE
ncbi:hypothetical protein D3C78_1271920 [compost metagenome]